MITYLFRYLCSLAMIGLCLSSFALNTYDTKLLDDLGGKDEKARANARQLLSRSSVTVVPKLLALVKDENAAIWNAAFNTLSDIANEVNVPGREKDRDYVTAQLMLLLDPNESAEIKMRGLKLVQIVLPNGYNVAPISALLNNPDLRERARASLQEAGTDKARAALAKALTKADPEFQCALLNSLYVLRDEKSLSRVARYTKSKDPRVRVAAARAISWQGTPDYMGAIISVYRSADEATAFEAADAMIRHADALPINGFDSSILYHVVLVGSKNPSVRGAALVGLVRNGDINTASTDIVAALNDPSGLELVPMVVSAFQNAQSDTAKHKLLKIYPAVSEDVRILLLGIIGGRPTPEYSSILQQESRSTNGAIRRAAFAAIGISGQSNWASILLDAAKAGNAEDKSFAVTELLRLADALAIAGDKEGAGNTYLAAYQLSDAGDAKQRAVAGIAKFPTPNSYDALMSGSESGAIKDLNIQTLSGIVTAMHKAGKEAETKRAATLMLARATTPEAIQEVIKVSNDTNAIPDLARQLGFVTSWNFAGPFPWSPADAFKTMHLNGTKVDTTATYLSAGKTIGWKKYATNDPGGIVDMSSAIAPESNVAGYGLATVSVPASIDAVARMGSDDGIKLWVNGAAVHENAVDRGTQVDQDKAPIKLKAGENSLLVEITQGGGGWNFCLRLTNADGSPLPFTNP
jgi:HEAT repeat protein